MGASKLLHGEVHALPTFPSGSLLGSPAGAPVTDISPEHMALAALRHEIDHLDDELLTLFERRLAIAARVGQAKDAPAGPHVKLRPDREQAVLARMLAKASPDNREAVESLWRQIVGWGLARQGRIKVQVWSPIEPTRAFDGARLRFGAAADMRAVRDPEAALAWAAEGHGVAVLAVNADVPARNVAELVAWAKAQGGKVNYSSLGNGSSAHLTMELLLSEAGFAATHVPFNGSPPAAMAVAQGEAQLTFMVAPALLPHVRNNKARLLAVTSAQRPDSLKDLPTMAEAGYPNVEALAWNGLVGPTSLSDAVAQRVATDVTELLKDAAVRQVLDNAGLTAVGGTPEAFRRFIEGDVKRWGPVITRLGVKLG